MARPDKLSKEAHKAIIDALAFGCTRKDAALSAGITYDTFNGWMNRGESEKRGKFFQFFHAVTVAEAEARKKYTATIAQAAAAGDWRAAETFLKRRDPDNWGDRQRIDIDVSQLDDEQLDRLARDGDIRSIAIKGASRARAETQGAGANTTNRSVD